MADSAVVGHLGTAQLAGLGVAAALLTTAVNIFVFLAYATTAAVARRVGAGDLPGALRQGMDGIWLALLLGAAGHRRRAARRARASSTSSAPPATAAPYAATYLRISALGIPAMLVVLAATGVLRGLQDTRTPLYVAVGGFTANAGLNAALVYGAGPRHRRLRLGHRHRPERHGRRLSVRSSSAAARRQARGRQLVGALRPDAAGIRACARAGVPLLVRTLSLRAVLVIATAVAARLGDTEIAAHQITLTLWSLLAFALDAIAIAGQAIIGRYLGAGDAEGARAACRRMVAVGGRLRRRAGAAGGAGRPLFVPLFTSDPAVQGALLPALLVVAAVASRCPAWSSCSTAC